MKIVINILKILLILTLIAALLLITYGIFTEKNNYLGLADHSKGAIYEINYYKPASKKAILLIPGLMASTLYDLETGDALWGYSRFMKLAVDLISAGNKSVEEKQALVKNAIDTFSCAENHIPLVKEKVGTMLDSDGYGSFGGMKYLNDMLKPLYGKQYDIITWQYDWRQSNTGSALELEKFVNYHGYEEVIFFTHSMGGVVVANYLARNEKNRLKTKLFVPFGCPFFGSMDAIGNLYESAIQSSGIMADAMSILSNSFETELSITDLARNFASVYELLPFNSFYNAGYFQEASPDFTGKTSPIYFENEPSDYENSISNMKKFDWTKMTNGKFKPALEKLEKYTDNLYIDFNGIKTFISDTVNTEYIVGVDLPTAVCAFIGKDGMLYETIKSDSGDGTVPSYSASAGNPLDAPNVHLVHGIAHGPLANGDDFEGNTSEKTGLKYVLGIMAKYVEKTDLELFGG